MTDSAAGPSMRPQLTSNRIRRHQPDPKQAGLVSVTTTPGITAGRPPVPANPPRPLGELAAAPAAWIAELAAERFSVERNGRTLVWRGMLWLLECLEAFPGRTWQQRWVAAGRNQPGRPVEDLAGDDPVRRTRFNAAAQQAYCMRLIQPSAAAFAATRLFRYSDRFRSIAQDPLLEEFCQRLERQPVTTDRRRRAILDVCAMLTVYGVDLGGLTAEAVLHYAERAPGFTAAATAWPVLHDMGRFPAWVPSTLQDARIRGQQPIEALVDRHRLRHAGIRDLLVDYLRRRSVEVDYATLDNLVRNLVQYFWKVVEDINPGQADLRLDEQTVQAWKQRLLVRSDGKPRLHIEGPFLAVRAFYLDLQAWAAAEPERWGRWVAPSPIRDTDLRWFNQRKRRIAERMANRTRERQALLPLLSEHVTDHWQRLREILDAAKQVGLGEVFTVDGVVWQRTSTSYDREQAGRVGEAIRVRNRDTGEVLWLSHEERQAFWQWAVVETLRLAGLRREELVELTHLSVRQYQRPNGEVVALLVVSPCKSDRERVIPMSAELFHVIAQVIRRHTAEQGTVPVCPRYDQAERAWCEPLPYLFQRLQSGSPRAMSIGMARDLVRARPKP